MRTERVRPDAPAFKLRHGHSIGDPWLFFALAAILAASLANLFGLSASMGEGLLLRQAVFALVGVLVFLAASFIRPEVYRRMALPLYGGGLAILVAVLLAGSVRHGTRGWFALGPLTLQPAEFARLPVMLLLAAFLHRREETSLRAIDTTVLIGIVVLPMGLILLQPDFGVALTYLPLLIAALWLGGLPRKIWVMLVILALFGAGLTWLRVLKPYQKERILTVLDPDRDPFGAGYQGRQSRIAVGAGGVTGQGLGQGSQSVLRFLPAQHTDFAFAAWAEATGFVGSGLLLAAYGLLFWRLGVISFRAESRYGIMLPLLALSWMAFQFIVNVGMILGWLPTTGITLPLFSYGGSSLLTSCATLGIVNAAWRSRMDFS